jgi:hypothetical protein
MLAAVDLKASLATLIRRWERHSGSRLREEILQVRGHIAAASLYPFLRVFAIMECREER